MNRAAIALTFGLSFALCACAAAAPTSTAEAVAAPSANASGAAPTATPSEAPAPKRGAPEPQKEPESTMASQRAPFVANCMQRARSKAYCECGWDQFQQIFKEADLKVVPGPNDPRIAALMERTKGQCASKLTDEQLQENFQEGCLAGEPKKEKYCGCAFRSLRKRLPREEFISGAPMASPAFSEEAQGAMLKECGPLLSEPLIKADFMIGCGATEDPSRVRSCECLWKKFRAKLSAQALLSAKPEDLKKVPGLEACK